MANTTSLLHKGLRGQLGQEVVFKQYGKKTIVTKYPDMSKVVATTQQQEGRKLFARAVAYAKLINNDPVLKKAYQQKVKKRQSVYHYAIKEFLRAPERCEERMRGWGKINSNL